MTHSHTAPGDEPFASGHVTAFTEDRPASSWTIRGCAKLVLSRAIFAMLRSRSRTDRSSPRRRSDRGAAALLLLCRRRRAGPAAGRGDLLGTQKKPPGRRHVPAREHAPRSGPARYGGRGRPAEEPGDWHLSGRRSRVVPGLSARVGPAQRRRDPRRRSHPRRYRLRSIGGSRPTW